VTGAGHHRNRSKKETEWFERSNGKSGKKSKARKLTKILTLTWHTDYISIQPSCQTNWHD
jgi:hypothetical protein